MIKQVRNVAVTSKVEIGNNFTAKAYLKQFLNLYWLRPESALLATLLAKNIDIDDKMKGNIDLSCGDGLFSFSLLGGKIGEKFNLYATSKVDSSIVDKKDIYDHFDKTYCPDILVPPLYRMRSGLDRNENMLSRAEQVGVYDELIHAQAENCHEIPGIRAGSYSSASIFSSIYMYKDVGKLLRAINAILVDEGRLIVNVKTPSFAQFYSDLENKYAPTFCRYIERNMRGILSNLKTVESWEDDFKKSGFVLESRRATMNTSMVPLWTIGLRSLSPLLIKLVDCIPDKQFPEIKADFINTFYSVLGDLVDQGDDISTGSEPVSLVYVLRKRSKLC